MGELSSHTRAEPSSPPPANSSRPEGVVSTPGSGTTSYPWLFWPGMGKTPPQEDFFCPRPPLREQSLSSLSLGDPTWVSLLFPART